MSSGQLGYWSKAGERDLGWRCRHGSRLRALNAFVGGIGVRGHVGRKHIRDILKLVSGTLVISFRCWKRKLTEITHSQGLLIIFSKLHNLRLNLKLLACTTSPAWSWVAAVRDVTVN